MGDQEGATYPRAHDSMHGGKCGRGGGWATHATAHGKHAYGRGEERTTVISAPPSLPDSFSRRSSSSSSFCGVSLLRVSAREPHRDCVSSHNWTEGGRGDIIKKNTNTRTRWLPLASSS